MAEGVAIPGGDDQRVAMVNTNRSTSRLSAALEPVNLNGAPTS